MFLFGCLLAPVVEELIFRGAFYHYLRCRYSVPVAVAVTAILFAVIHPQGLVAVPLLATLGSVFALVREWRGSIVATITAHAFNNFIGMSLLFLLL